MDYEQKYKEALKWMQGLYRGLHGATKEEAERFFPELKESKDERIRKTLIAFFRDWERTKSHCWNVNVTNIIAWLEKQGEQTQLDYEHADIPQKDFAPIEHKMLYADEIEWFRVNGWNSHIGNHIDEFKKDFGL